MILQRQHGISLSCIVIIMNRIIQYNSFSRNCCFCVCEINDPATQIGVIYCSFCQEARRLIDAIVEDVYCVCYTIVHIYVHV